MIFPESIFLSAHGCVTQCPCCGDLAVTFREMAFPVTRTDLPPSQDAVAQIVRRSEWVEAHSGGRLRTGGRTVCCDPWEGDPAEVHALLDGAVDMFDLSGILRSSPGTSLTALA